MSQISYAIAGVTAPSVNTDNSAVFFRAFLDAFIAAHNDTDTTVSAAVASGVGNGGKLAKYAGDGSMAFAGTSTFVGISASGSVAAGGNVSANGNGVFAGVLTAGSGSNQITTAAGLVDAAKLTVPLPAPGTANNVLLSNGTAWTAAQLTSTLLNSLIADGSLSFAKVTEGRVTANGTNLTLHVAGMRYFDQNLNPVLFGGGPGGAGVDYTVPSGQVPAGGNCYVVVYLGATGSIGSVAGATATSPVRPGEQVNSQTLAYVYLRDGATAIFQADQSAAHTGYVEDWRNPWVFGGGSGSGGSGVTIPLPVTQGGTNSTDPTSARAQLGAAASGVNSDITQLGITNSALAFTGGITQSGTFAPPASGSPIAHFVNTTVKPTASGGVPRSVYASGAVDMSGLAANSTNNVNTAAAYYAGATGRSGSHTRADMYDAYNLFTANFGATTGGTYTIADGQAHTTASISATALVGAPDGSTAGSINAALVTAASTLRAVDGELVSGTSVNLIQTHPGPQATASIASQSGITTTGPVSTTLTLTQTVTAQIPLYSGVGFYANQPANNVTNNAILVTGSMASPGGVDGYVTGTNSANEYGIQAALTIPAGINAYQGWQKTGIGSTVTVNQGRVTKTVGTIEGDAVAGDFTVLAPAGVASVNLWALHVLAKLGSSGGGAATGTAIGIEGQVISYSGTDPGRIDSGLTDHAIGVNMVGGEPGQAGQQNLTAAYVVSAVNNDLSGATKPYWHQGFVVTTRVANGGAAVGNGATDTAYELQDQWAVYLGGKMSVGSTTRVSTSDLLEIISTQTNGMTQRWDQYGHEVAGQALPPTATLFGGAGTGGSPVASVTVVGNDHRGLITVTTNTGGTAPAAAAGIVQITYRNAYPAAPDSLIIEPANTATNNLAVTQEPFAPSANNLAGSFFITSGSVALAANTTYAWWYRIN